MPADHDALGPDGAELRLLPTTSRASMVHCTLPAGSTTRAARHRSVDELWFVVGGTGQVWRHQSGVDEIVDVGPDTSLSVPLGTHVQLRATGPEPLRFVVCTVPPSPGDHEAVPVEGPWPPPPDPGTTSGAPEGP